MVNRDFSFSPDGNKIAFRSQRNNELPQLWLLDTSINSTVKLTTNGIYGSFAWSPNGEKIVYTQHNYNNWSYANGTLWIVNVNTGYEVQLTFN